MTSHRVRLAIGAFLIGSVLPAGARGQSIVTGELEGTVADSGGRPIPGALVTLRVREASGAIRVSGPDGRFTFDFLVPGSYQLLAEALGWRPLLVDRVAIAPGRRAAVAVVLSPSQPPVDRRDTVASAGIPSAVGATLAWLTPELIEELPGAGPELASLVSLGGALDEGSGMEGLPERLVTLQVDGHPFRPARHPVAAGDPARGLLVPRNGVRSVVQPRATDIEWPGGAGTVAVSTGVRRPGVPTIFGMGSGDAGWKGSVLDGDPPAFTSWWNGAGATLALVPDTALVHLAVESGRWRRPLVAPASASVAEALGERFADLGLTQLSESTWTSGSLKLDWTMVNGGALQAAVTGATFRDNFPGRAAPVLRYQSSPGAVEGTDVLGGVDLAVPITDLLALEIRVEGGLSRRVFGREDDPRGPATVLADPALWLGGPPQDAGEIRRTEIGGTAALHVARGPHRAKFGVHPTLATHRYDLLEDTRGTFLFGDVGDAGARGLYVERTSTLPAISFATPSVEAFGQYRWSAAPGVTLTVGGRYGVVAYPVDEIRLDDRWLDFSGLRNDSIPASSRSVGGIAHGSWDPTGRNRTVLEGAIGVDYGEVDPSHFWEVIANGGVLQTRRLAGALASWPTAPPASQGTRAVSLTLLDPELSAPRTSRTLVGLAHRFQGGVTLRVEASARRTELLLRRADLNAPVQTAFTGEGSRPINAPIEAFGGVVGPTPSTLRRFGEYDAVWALNGDGWSQYRGVTVGLERALGGRGGIALGYTYSETTDNLFGLGAGDATAALPSAIGGSLTTPWEEGRSDLDIPHRGVASVSLPIPGRLLGNLSAVYRGRSGSPFTPMAGRGLDVNGDGSWSNDVAWIPEGDSVRTAAEQAGCIDVAAASFAARNACRGPAVHEVDVRLSLGPMPLGRAGLEVTLDVINATDQGEGIRDDALFVLDRARPISTAGSRLTIPYRLNPGFGSLIARTDRGRQLRVGLRLGALR